MVLWISLDTLELLLVTRSCKANELIQMDQNKEQAHTMVYVCRLCSRVKLGYDLELTLVKENVLFGSPMSKLK